MLGFKKYFKDNQSIKIEDLVIGDIIEVNFKDDSKLVKVQGKVLGMFSSFVSNGTIRISNSKFKWGINDIKVDKIVSLKMIKENSNK